MGKGDNWGSYNYCRLTSAIDRSESESSVDLRTELELPRFRGQFFVFIIFVLCIDLTQAQSDRAQARAEAPRGFFD